MFFFSQWIHFLTFMSLDSVLRPLYTGCAGEKKSYLQCWLGMSIFAKKCENHAAKKRLIFSDPVSHSKQTHHPIKIAVVIWSLRLSCCHPKTYFNCVSTLLWGETLHLCTENLHSVLSLIRFFCVSVVNLCRSWWRVLIWTLCVFMLFVHFKSGISEPLMWNASFKRSPKKET